MLRAYRVADVRAAEEAVAATLPDGELMRRASRGLADALSDVAVGEVVLVLVGPGNNGGDALYAAVHLLDRGVRVDLCLLDEQKAHPEGLAAATAGGARVVDEPSGQRWCVDAVLGIGARPGLTGKALDWLRWIERTTPTVVAVDVPSGVDVDGATADGDTVRATRTVTFGVPKPCLLVDPAAGAAGADPPVVVDIGITGWLSKHADACLEAIEPADGAVVRTPGGAVDKYARGVVGVAAGSEQYAGAAHLCVAGAQAGPAGMIRFVGSDALGARVVDRAPEVVVGRGRVQAWVVGPGGGDDVERQLSLALEDGVPVVVDASALAHLPSRPGVPTVITPHAGELASMMGTTRDAVEADPLGHATSAAERWGATVLLKGRRTLVAQLGRPTRVNLSGTPWLATAGAGDVLAGLVGSLLAGGATPLDAASRAAFLHGAAGVRANPGGPVTASAVAAALPATIADFRSGRLGTVR